ncbi:MAG: DUF16 domain-containing protein [Deltaproteobacteria bacterium]|nr:DUF16 domain-containing protein [Deltaproteobacteria bacterium]
MKKKSEEGVGFSGLFGNELSPEERERHRDILFEDMRSMTRSMAETITLQNEATHRQLEEFRADFSKDIGMLKLAVTEHSKQLQGLTGDVKGLKSDVKELKSDVKELKQRTERIEHRVERVEQKLDVVCERTDHIEDRVDGHDLLLRQRA